jgi:HNH endonuclease
VAEPDFKAWSLLTLGTTAHGVSNYADELGISYAYDTTVANSKYIEVGDLAVVRDNQLVLGAGWIDSIETVPETKIRPRCPRCGSTDFKMRKTRQPRYRCQQCENVFDDPDNTEEISVQASTANFSRTWRFVDRPFPAGLLDAAYVARAKQNAVRRLDEARVRPLIDSHLETGEPWWSTYVREDTRIPGGHGVALSKTRLGQQRFREEMLTRFGERCAFTGRQPPGALEAAHLYLYSKTPEHDLKGGLLLRSDLHALFDRWLITIDPDYWTIDLAPDLDPYPALTALRGQPVQIPPHLRPRDEYVREHAMICRDKWNKRRAPESNRDV